jgi:heme/copper-type cytochrome/quinol oxidase subunit 2
MAWLFWTFIAILVFVVTAGTVVIFRMRKKHRKTMADIGKKLEYYEKNGFLKKD